MTADFTILIIKYRKVYRAATDMVWSKTHRAEVVATGKLKMMR